MYNSDIIKDEFYQLIGVDQIMDPDIDPLPSSVINGPGRLLVYHSLINGENLDQIAKNFADYNFPDYSAASTYKSGERIKSAGLVYESKIDDNLNNLVSDINSWERINWLGLYLEKIFKQASEQVVQDMLTAKRLRGDVRTILRQMRIYEGYGNPNTLIVNEGALVGLRIDVLHRQNLAFIIERIGIQTSTSQSLNMYLFHSSNPRPIQIIPIQTDAYVMKWNTPQDSASYLNKIMLQYLAENHDSGGSFYLVYDQDELDGQAIKKEFTYGDRPCGGCSPYNINAYEEYSRYVYLNTIKILAEDRGGVDGLDLWNLSKMKRMTSINYGLNLDITIRCDITRFLVDQKDLFGPAIQSRAVTMILEEMINSTRQNGISEKVKQMARFSLQDMHTGGEGIRRKAQKEAEAIDFEFSKLDATCLPCQTRRGIKNKSFGLAGH